MAVIFNSDPKPNTTFGPNCSDLSKVDEVMLTDTSKTCSGIGDYHRPPYPYGIDPVRIEISFTPSHTKNIDGLVLAYFSG